jgi:hypothetical protein
VSLAGLSRRLGRAATLDDFPDSELDWLAAAGFDWTWFLGVWRTGEAGRRISLSHPEWRREYQELLGDFQDSDVCGSCFAIREYSVQPAFGGDEALARLRARLHQRGMRLLLDFVPNHTSPDHPWAERHPEYYVHGSDDQLAREPQNYTRVATPGGTTVLAFGRDPYFSGWPDTLQLNYAAPGLREAMASELESIAARCDGVRCDMAMLILPEVFERTWGLRPESFWPEAIQRIREKQPDFLFMAEVYWDLEWTLQRQGFDYTYDKRLYDRLRDGHARPVRDHLRADMQFQLQSARFLENHDEPRAAAVFDLEKHKAAAVLTFLCPGLRFIHQGQMQGYTKRIPVHLGRGPQESANAAIERFYGRLLEAVGSPQATSGNWQLLDCTPAWEGNWTWDSYICFAWRGAGSPLIVAVNYSPYQSQCYMRMSFPELLGAGFRLRDLLGEETYVRDGNELLSKGLYLDLPPWGYNVFELQETGK